MLPGAGRAAVRTASKSVCSTTGGEELPGGARGPPPALPNHPQPPAALCVAVVRTPYSDGIQMWV